MAKIVTYKCERCGEEWNAERHDIQPVTIQLSFNFGNIIQTNNPSPRYTTMWCRECVMKTGISLPNNKEDLKLANGKQLSLEERIIEFIEELGFMRNGE